MSSLFSGTTEDLFHPDVVLVPQLTSLSCLISWENIKDFGMTEIT